MSEDIFNITSSTLSDSSIINLGKDEFVVLIVPKLQNILNRVFSDTPAKQKIKIYKDRISFAAPCCGDSAHDKYKKRGNIILEGKFKNLYKCFNCGTCMSLPNFFRQYGEDLSLSEIDYITSNRVDISTFYQAVGVDSVNYLYDINEVEKYAINREQFKSRLKLVECSEENKGHNYLVGRRQFDFRKFLYSCQADKLFVLNLTPNGNIIGMQVRRFDKSGPKYKTYNLQKIHEMVMKDNVVVPDEINSLSMLFNILLVDCTRMVTVTEGPMDAFLLKNSMALCGAAKNIDFPFEHRYLFDSDKTGREHTTEKLKEGYPVFMWEKYIEDSGLPKQKKWDVNDVVLYAMKNNMKLPSIEEYFTDDELDLILI